MKPNPSTPDIYQLRIVLRDISPLIWRRLLVRSDTTLAQLHLMIQILFAWGNEHLHHFHVFGQDYGSDGADTRTVRLHASACATASGSDTSTIITPSGNATFVWKRRCRLTPSGSIPCAPAASGRPRLNMCQMPGPIWRYSMSIVTHHGKPCGCWPMRLRLLDAPEHVSIRDAIGDLDEIREAMDRLELYQQFQPEAFKRRQVNAQLRTRTWAGDDEP
jgi:hypothetical protein